MIGGSQGARILNETVPRALAELPPDRRPEVRHQAGRLGFAAAREAYAALRVEATVEEFIDDVGAAYRWADLVVARAGALTVTELAAIGVGAILVPFKAAIDDHQTRNAEHFVRGGAGIVLAEQELSPTRLAGELGACLGDFDRLVAMAEAARAQARLSAAEKLADACVEAAEARA